MNMFSSVMALVSTILALLALLFIWNGNEQVEFAWVAMDDDISESELAATRNPVEDTSYTAVASTPTPTAKKGENFVLWLNISGFRGDYVEKADTPFLDDLEGGTNQLSPAFPSLRYPSLMSQATGQGIEGHGIPSDSMIDPTSGDAVLYPTNLTLLKSEPIWTTVKRQGQAVLVHDWPFSQQQPTEHAADIFLPTFDPEKSDQDRLDGLLNAWSGHAGPEKLRLIMGSLFDLEKSAQANGSREKETYDSVTKLDQQLKTFLESVKSKWPELRSNEGDLLWVMLTTDHGMTDSAKVINFKELMGPLADQVRFTSKDAVASIWFKDPPAGSTRELQEKKYDEELKARIYWRSYAPGSYPSLFNFGAGGDFLGDRFLVLKGGYSFTDESGSEAVFDPSETGGPFAVSGYHPNDSSRMMGQGFFFELNGTGYSRGVGQVESPQLHPTVCKLLKITPAEGVTAAALDLD